jgi:hypothetical protein
LIPFAVAPLLLALGIDLPSLRAERRQETVEVVREIIGCDRIDDVLAALLLVHQSRVMKDGKMLGDRRHRHVEFLGNLANRHRPAGEVIENASPGCRSECLERLVHRYFPN